METMSSPHTSTEPSSRAELAKFFLWEASRSAPGLGFDQYTLSSLSDIDIPFPGRVIVSLTVSPPLTNRYRTLHGGCIAALVDIISTAALLTLTDLSGVSLDLNVTYLNAAQVGAQILVMADVLKVGRSTAVMSVDIVGKNEETDKLWRDKSGAAQRRVEGKMIIAQGRHTKFLPNTDYRQMLVEKRMRSNL